MSSRAGSRHINSLLNEKSGINSSGFDTIQVLGAHSVNEAASNINQYKLNYDPNPIVIRKTDPRGPVQYKQKVFVRYLQPPAAPEPGPIIVKEKRPPPAKPLPPLIVRQRAPRAKTPPPLILRELPPDRVRPGGPRYVPAGGQRGHRQTVDMSGYHYGVQPHTRAHKPNLVESNHVQNDEFIRGIMGEGYDQYGGSSQGWITEISNR